MWREAEVEFEACSPLASPHSARSWCRQIKLGSRFNFLLLFCFVFPLDISVMQEKSCRGPQFKPSGSCRNLNNLGKVLRSLLSATSGHDWLFSYRHLWIYEQYKSENQKKLDTLLNCGNSRKVEACVLKGWLKKHTKVGHKEIQRVQVEISG